MSTRRKKDGNYSRSWKFLKQIKNYVYISIALFFVFAIFGFIFPVFFKDEILSFVKNITAQISNYNLPELISFIFLNNLKASFFAMLLGVIFGFFPVITAIINGYLVGFVAKYAVSEGGLFVLWKLLPHGIFELPAVLISIGMGLRLGRDLIRTGKEKDILKKDFMECMRLFLFIIIPLLLIAAVIEGTLIFVLR